MPARLALSFALLFAVSCHDDSGGGGTPDLAVVAQPDLSATADLAVAPDAVAVPDATALPDEATPPDLVTPDDFAGSFACTTDADCRLFSSYCTTMPCACIPLAKNEAPPACMGGMVTCFVDPCANKSAACDMATHRCIAK